MKSYNNKIVLITSVAIKADLPNCDSCGVIVDVYHLLVERVCYQRERQALEVTNQLTILTSY